MTWVSNWKGIIAEYTLAPVFRENWEKDRKIKYLDINMSALLLMKKKEKDAKLDGVDVALKLWLKV